MTPTTLRLTEVVQAEAAAREERDSLILKRRAEGASMRVIAMEAGIHRRSVQRILEAAQPE